MKYGLEGLALRSLRTHQLIFPASCHDLDFVVRSAGLLNFFKGGKAHVMKAHVSD